MALAGALFPKRVTSEKTLVLGNACWFCRAGFVLPLPRGLRWVFSAVVIVFALWYSGSGR